MRGGGGRSSRERDVLKPVCDFLEVYNGKHWVYVRTQNVRLARRMIDGKLRWTPGYKRPSQNGVPDVFLFPFFCQTWFAFEFKSQKGKQSPDQIKWEKWINESSGSYYIVREANRTVDFLKHLLRGNYGTNF